ncbi:MAG: HAD family hydrolase, partial [Propioniciclava sp.]
HPVDLHPRLPADPRLVVSDMDGTLLNEHSRIPEEFWQVLADLRRAGITFAIASGRQYPSLEDLFDRDRSGVAFIADNGGYVVRDGAEIASFPLSRAAARGAVRAVRGLADAADIAVVWSGRTGAYVEHTDPDFVAQAHSFYPGLQIVGDLTAVGEEPIKLSIVNPRGPSPDYLAALQAAAPEARLLQTTETWVDVIHPQVDKGSAVVALQTALGISADQTVVFGDYLNDLEMMGVATFAFAMANAHPDVVERAKAVVPSNRELGAIRTMASLLG